MTIRQQVHKRRRWLRWLNIILVIYLVVGVALFWFQDRILFHPEVLQPGKSYEFPEPVKETNLPVDEGSNINVVQFLTRDSLPKGVVLYFQGNQKNISRYAAYAPAFTKSGYEVWMVDYPGFGKSTGTLTEQKLYEDAMQLYLLALSKFPSNRIVLYGKSFGTGIASWLGAKKTCEQIILETPYYSMTSLVQHYLPIYPVKTFLKYSLPVYKYLSLANAPVTIFQGNADDVIPYNNAHRLTEVMHPKDRFITIEKGGHNNLHDFPVFRHALDSLLNSRR